MKWRRVNDIQPVGKPSKKRSLAAARLGRAKLKAKRFFSGVLAAGIITAAFGVSAQDINTTKSTNYNSGEEMARRVVKSKAKINERIDSLIKNAQAELKKMGLDTEENLYLLSNLGKCLKIMNKESYSPKDEKFIERLMNKEEILKDTHGDKSYDYVMEKLRELVKPSVDVDSIEEEYGVVGVMAKVLSKYEKSGGKPVFEDGTLNDSKYGFLRALLAQGVPAEEYERGAKARPSDLTKVTPIRPPREGAMRGAVSRKEAGRGKYPHDIRVDRKAGKLSIEERVKRADDRLKEIEKIVREEKIVIRPKDEEKVRAKFGSMNDSELEKAQHKINLGKVIAKWRENVEMLKGLSAEALKENESEYRGMTIDIPQATTVKKIVKMAKGDASKFNDIYEGNYSYFETITPEWLSTMKSTVQRIESRTKMSSYANVEGDGDIYGAIVHNEITGLTSKIKAVEEIASAEWRINQIYGELSGRLGNMEYEGIPGDIAFDPSTGAPSIPQITTDSEGKLVFPTEVTDIDASRVTTNRAMAEESLKDMENVLGKIFRDPDTHELAKRYFLQFYSAWHKKYVGKKMTEGQEYKYYTEGLRKLINDPEFIAERQIMVRVLNSVELIVEGARGREPQVIDNTQVTANFMALSMETQYAIIQLAKKVGGTEGMNQQLLTNIAVFINNLNGHSPAYSPVLVDAIGEQLVTQFNSNQVHVISNYVLGFERTFVATGQYKELEQWYFTLPTRMNELFTTIRDLMKESREPGRDIRVRMPSEEDWVEVYQPAARITIQVPKHVYYDWVSTGVIAEMPDQASVRTLIPKDLRTGMARQPSSLETEARFFEQGIVYAEVLKPHPFIRIPVTVENLGVLAPEIIPRLGPWHTFRSQIGTAYTYSGEFGDPDSLASLTAGERVDVRGMGKYAMQQHMEKIAGEERTSLGSVQARRIDDFSKAAKKAQWKGNDVINSLAPKGADSILYAEDAKTGKEEESDQEIVNSLAPMGADTVIYLKKSGENYRAHIYKRAEEHEELKLAEQKDLDKAEAEMVLRDQRMEKHTTQGQKVSSMEEDTVLWNVDAQYMVEHNNPADEEEVLINSLAPKGADTVIYFKHIETEEGVDRYRAYVYKRFENGVFGLADYEDLEPEEAREMYEGVFQEMETSDVVRKMYAETGVMGTGGDKTVIGDWRTSLDGCVLFAGNDDEFMAEEYITDENGNIVRDEGAMFQGVGASLEKYNTGGGFGSYEHTRMGRMVVGGGAISAEDRSFAIGRVFGKNIREPTITEELPPAETGRIGLVDAESQSDYTDFEVDMWLLKDRKYNVRAFMNTVGIGKDEAKYGGIAQYMGNEFYGGGSFSGMHDKGEWSASSYGMWGKELANALVASVLLQTAGTEEETQLADVAAGAIFAIRSNLELQGIVAYHKDLEGEILAPRQRAEGAEQLGTVAKFVWDPTGSVNIERVEMLGAYYQRAPSPTEGGETVRGGIGGGALEWEGAIPGTAEAYFPGMGELKLSIGKELGAGVDLVAGGGRTLFESYGGHTGVRGRMGRLTLFGVGAVEEGGVTSGLDLDERARILDGMIGFRFFLSEPESTDMWKLQMFGGVSGIVEQFEETSEYPWQVDFTLGIMGTEAFQRLSASVGLSHWEFSEDWRNRLMLSIIYNNLEARGAVHDLFFKLSVGHDWTPTEGSGTAYLDFGFRFW